MSPNASLPVVILCGGIGTRLREETEFKPKPLVQIAGMPILWHIMKIYGHHGFRRFILCLGYKGHLIKEFFLNYPWMANDVTLELKTHKPQPAPGLDPALVAVGAQARLMQASRLANQSGGTGLG